MMKQKEAVYNAVTGVFKDAGIHFEDGDNASESLTPEFRKSVHAIITEGFTQGNIALEDSPANKEKMSTPAKMNSYVSGLISNWLRKDTRLNGDVAYVAKNPGSRAGSGDETVKTYRALIRKYSKTDPSKVPAIQKYLDARVAELKSKGSVTELTPEQIASLPEELRETLGFTSEN